VEKLVLQPYLLENLFYFAYFAFELAKRKSRNFLIFNFFLLLYPRSLKIIYPRKDSIQDKKSFHLEFEVLHSVRLGCEKKFEKTSKRVNEWSNENLPFILHKKEKEIEVSFSGFFCLEMKRKINFKIVILGEQKVGKSSIVKRFYKDDFKEKYKPTTGMKMKLKKIDINNKSVKIQIFEVPTKQNQQIYKNFLHGADGVVLVYDISSKDSFHFEEWLLEYLKLLQKEQGTKVMIVGNKLDLEREVSTKEGEEFSSFNGFFFMEVSSKLGENVDEIFVKLVNERRKDLNEEEEEEEEEKLIETNEIKKANLFCCCYFY
jgi:small GTP-binding protein